MMSALVRFSIRFHGVIIGLACLMVLYGIYSLTRSNLDVFPEFSPTQIIKMAFQDTFLLKVILLSWIKTWRTILFSRRYFLWQPIPSIATHMESTGIAPNIDWIKIVNDQKPTNSDNKQVC